MSEIFGSTTTTPLNPDAFSGGSGVYVGTGEMPEGYDVQIDPEGSFDIDDNWELIEGISVKEEAVVERTYPGKYKKILVVLYSEDKIPRMRLKGDNYQYWEFYSYSNYQYQNMFVFGEIVAPNIFSNVYATAGNAGGSANLYLPIIERFKNTATYFNGFKTDSACKKGTAIRVYGVKA